jgi:hypothetical protein
MRYGGNMNESQDSGRLLQDKQQSNYTQWRKVLPLNVTVNHSYEFSQLTLSLCLIMHTAMKTYAEVEV